MEQPKNDQAAIAQALRDLHARFAGRLPQDARKGAYDTKPGDGLGDDAIEAPDGVYRVEGSEWLLRIRKGRFVQASRAMPPKFGGPGVIAVSSTTFRTNG